MKRARGILRVRKDFSNVNKLGKRQQKAESRRMTKLGAVLKAYFEASGETQSAFAARTGAHASKLSRIQENGELPRPQTLEKIIFGLPADLRVPALAAYLADYLPQRIFELIEIHRRGVHAQAVDVPLDDLEIAFGYLRQWALGNRRAREMVLNLGAIAKGGAT